MQATLQYQPAQAERRRNRYSRRLAATLATVLLPTGTMFGVVAPAIAATHEVATAEQLADAFANAKDGDEVIVTGDIAGDATSPDVEVPHGTAVTLDLSGHTVTLIGTENGDAFDYSNNPGIWVPPTAGLTITATGGGTLNARGSGHSAGLGGMYLSELNDSASGSITIHGGTIIATGSDTGAGIGGARHAGGGETTITGGHVTASSTQGAGIGSGVNGRAAVIAITGGTVTASSERRAGIGGDGDLTINIANATVHASSDYSGAGIGSGYSARGAISITIESGNVTAVGANTGAGIGGGRYSSNGTITINGGTIDARGGAGAAGIGGGGGDLSRAGSGGIVAVNGGIVAAVGGVGAPGIGGGRAGHDGRAGAGADLTIADGASVSVATTGASALGAGSGSSGTNNFGSLTNIGELSIPVGSSVTIPGSISVTNDGTLLNAGTIQNNGTIRNDGTIRNAGKIATPGAIINQGGIVNSGTIDEPDHVTKHNTLIMFNGDGGTSPDETRVYAATFDAGEVSFPESTHIGHDFMGWFTDTGDPVTSDTDLGANGPTELPLTAQWMVTEHTVSFNTRGGSTLDDVTVNDGELLQAPESPIQEGYTFNGWYDNSDLLPPMHDFSTPVTSDITLYAGWEEAPVISRLALHADATVVDEGGSITISAIALDTEGNELGDVTNEITLESDIDSDMVDGNRVTFPTASEHTITATHGASDVTAALVITVIPVATGAPSDTPSDTASGGNQTAGGGTHNAELSLTGAEIGPMTAAIGLLLLALGALALGIRALALGIRRLRS